MTSVFTAQETLHRAGSLSAHGAHGGVDTLTALATSPSTPCVPMTDPAQANTFVPAVTPPTNGCAAPTRPFDLFTAWQSMPAQTGMASAANGERLFNTRQVVRVAAVYLHSVPHHDGYR
jgi:hypothetical protein